MTPTESDQSMRSARYHATVAGATITLVLTLSGCGGADQQPAVATAVTGSAQPSTSATSSAVAQYVAGQRKYAQCLRDGGFTVPDPDAKGKIDFGSDLGKLKSDPNFRATTKKCEDLVPPIPAELVDGPPPLTAEQLQRLRDYAKCERANGNPDFPDPGPNGFEVDRSARPGSATPPSAEQIWAGGFCAPVLKGLPPATPDPNATGIG
jgi:hypothetical protein